MLTKVAARKTAGVLGDDLALNAEPVAGVQVDRELCPPYGQWRVRPVLDEEPLGRWNRGDVFRWRRHSRAQAAVCSPVGTGRGTIGESGSFIGAVLSVAAQMLVDALSGIIAKALTLIAVTGVIKVVPQRRAI